MICRKSHSDTPTQLNSEYWITLKLMLQVIAIMVLIYCAEIFG
ncbi:hypothetical protein [Aurantivibrio infirmus]